MIAKCGLCKRPMVARSEGEMCPRCVERFARHAERYQAPVSIFDDAAGLLVGAALVGLVGLLVCAFYPV